MRISEGNAAGVRTAEVGCPSECKTAGGREWRGGSGGRELAGAVEELWLHSEGATGAVWTEKGCDLIYILLVACCCFSFFF